MQRIHQLALAIALAAAFCASSERASADVIELRADPWCPYNCEPGSDRPGFMVEIAREALAMFGHEINYETLNWARSLRKAETGEIAGVIGAIPEEAPSLIYGAPIAPYVDAVAVQRGTMLDVMSAEGIEGLRVGAINGYEYYGAMRDYIDAHRDDRTLVQFMSGDNALEKNLRKLAAGRLDLVAEVRSVLEYTIAELGMDAQFEIVDTSDVEEVYIAFSPANDRGTTYSRQLSEGLERLRASGRLEAIMGKYTTSRTAS